MELWAAWPIGRWTAGPLGQFTTYALDFCQYMNIVRFYSTGCLYVSRFGWSTGFLPLLKLLIFTELAHSFCA